MNYGRVVLSELTGDLYAVYWAMVCHLWWCGVGSGDGSVGLQGVGTGLEEWALIRERINTCAGRGICVLEGSATVYVGGDEGREQAEVVCEHEEQLIRGL